MTSGSFLPLTMMKSNSRIANLSFTASAVLEPAMIGNPYSLDCPSRREARVTVAAMLRLDLALLVESVDLLEHVERRVAGVDFMFGIIQRRIPERHDRVAH